MALCGTHSPALPSQQRKTVVAHSCGSHDDRGTGKGDAPTILRKRAQHCSAVDGNLAKLKRPKATTLASRVPVMGSP
jgi:hypothetical protein